MFHGDETLVVISIVLLGHRAAIYGDDGRSESVGWPAERKRRGSASRKPGPEASRVNGRLSDCTPRTRIDKNDCRPVTQLPFDYVAVGLRVDGFRASAHYAVPGDSLGKRILSLRGFCAGACEIADRGWRKSFFVHGGDTIAIANADLRLGRCQRNSKKLNN